VEINQFIDSVFPDGTGKSGMTKETPRINLGTKKEEPLGTGPGAKHY